MITWISKGLIAVFALTALTALAACEGVPGATGGKPLSQAPMANGALILRAPPGYCIDSGALQQRFALLARCDRLGAPDDAAQTAPLAVITVSVLKAPQGATLPRPDAIARAQGLTAISDARTDSDAVFFRATGPAPAEGLSLRQWHGMALIEGQFVGLALYGAAQSETVPAQGGRVLLSLIDATRAAN